MGGSWGQDENPKKKMVHEAEDETRDKFESLYEVIKLDSAKEDKQEYIYKELDIGAEVMLNK